MMAGDPPLTPMTETKSSNLAPEALQLVAPVLLIDGSRLLLPVPPNLPVGRIVYSVFCAWAKCGGERLCYLGIEIDNAPVLSEQTDPSRRARRLPAAATHTPLMARSGGMRSDRFRVLVTEADVPVSATKVQTVRS